HSAKLPRSRKKLAEIDQLLDRQNGSQPVHQVVTIQIKQRGCGGHTLTTRREHTCHLPNSETRVLQISHNFYAKHGVEARVWKRQGLYIREPEIHGRIPQPGKRKHLFRPIYAGDREAPCLECSYVVARATADVKHTQVRITRWEQPIQPSREPP